jgi:hypothetical protein
VPIERAAEIIVAPETCENQRPIGPDVATSHAGASLPQRLAALINPAVIAKRRASIEARLADRAGDAIRRQRCAEVIANTLLSTHNEN